MLRLLLLAPLLLALAYCGHLQPAGAHDGGDGISAWYRSLRTYDGTSCCDIADCHPVLARLKGDHWEIRPEDAEGAWQPVPDAAVLRRENPEGRPIGCIVAGQVRCFIPPAGT